MKLIHSHAPVLALLLLWAPTAGADLVERRAGAFFARAKIEILRVEDPGPVRGVKGVIIRSIRGRKVGRRITVDPMIAPRDLVAGDTILRACADRICITGKRRGDLYPLQTRFLGHGIVHILPGMVEARSLDALSRGGKPPPICLDARIWLSDEPERSVALRATVAAGDGTGKARGALLKNRGATLWVAEGRVHLSLKRKNGAPLSLSGALPHRRIHHRYNANLVPSWPVARTLRSLRRAFAGRTKRVTLARGTLRISARKGAKPRSYPLSISFDEDNGLQFNTSLFTDKSPYQNHSSLAGRMLSFPTRLRPRQKGQRYLGLVSGFPRGPLLIETLLRELHEKRRLRWAVRLHGSNDQGVVVGQATLQHVPDPK